MCQRSVCGAWLEVSSKLDVSLCDSKVAGFCVLAMLVKGGSTKQAPNALVGLDSENWGLSTGNDVCDFERAFQGIAARNFCLIGLRGNYRRMKTVIARIDNATKAQHLALNDAALDTYPKIMDAVR